MNLDPAFSFCFMRPGDAGEVGAVAQRIWRAHYSSLISKEQIDYMLAKNYSIEALQNALEDKQSVLLIKHEGEICGFLGIGPLENVRNPILRGEDTGEGAYFLHRCYLVPELHGKGLGKVLFSEMLNRMPRINVIRLQVHRENKKAHHFYDRLGFKIVAEADFDIGGGFIMQDYVMQWAR